jgi:HSP20 family protein
LPNAYPFLLRGFLRAEDGEIDVFRRKELNMKTLEKWNPFRLFSSWDPFREMEMQARLGSLFGGRFPLLKPGTEEGLSLTEWVPPVDITEDEKEYIIRTELPGVKKEDVKVTVEGGVLSITGERKVEKEEKEKKYHRLEPSYGRFIRSFTVSEGASSDKVVAEFKDGVLSVRLPKDEKAKPKLVDVQIG